MSGTISRRSLLLLSARLATLAAVGHLSALPRAAADSINKLTPSERVLINRLTWGLNAACAKAYYSGGYKAFIDEQLQSGVARLPAPVQARIDAMMLSTLSSEKLIYSIRNELKAIREASDNVAKRAARKTLQTRTRQLQSEVMERTLLRCQYSPYQLQERLTWFWCNHFNVSVYKMASMRALVPDFEERAIRPNVFGRFEDLLMATVRHPAMLVYLDNVRNRAGRLNENYGRELLELHTLGVDGGYTQSDVTNLSRALTGLGVNFNEGEIKVAKKFRDFYVRDGLFEFHPARHDSRDKMLLGQHISAGGMDEVERVVRVLARHPSTAKYLARKLATYFVADTPPDTLVDAMTASYSRSDGDLLIMLRTMLAHETFKDSLLEDDFKDPMRYVLSGMRMLYPPDDRLVINARLLSEWLRGLDEQPFARLTPDGYPIRRADWQGSGQMSARFDVARRMAGGPAQLFYKGKPPEGSKQYVPSAGKVLYGRLLAGDVRSATREALRQARNLQEWNELWLASPDFMHA